ncbi:transposase [Cooperia oncophora]
MKIGLYLKWKRAGASQVNQLTHYQKLIFIKRRFAISSVGLQRIVYYELLPPNRTINSDVYIEQLTKLNNAVEEKRPELTNRKGVFFANKNQKFYERGIMMLPERWQKVIDKNGQYITE